jgi:hypothetical protein
MTDKQGDRSYRGGGATSLGVCVGLGVGIGVALSVSGSPAQAETGASGE